MDKQMDKQQAELFGKHFTEGVLETIGKWVFIALVAVLIFAVLSGYFRWGFDSTDNMATGKRSNLSLRTDYGTGCQYLETNDGGLTPRRDRDGRQICNRVKSEALLTDAEITSIYSEAKPWKPTN